MLHPEVNLNQQTSKSLQQVVRWLWFMCFLVILMVVIGGITRLTGSGLSIVEWKPLMGAIPPLNHSDWLEVFGKYQNSPQGQMVNQGMSLAEFQWIFFWEYFHRLIGRSLGVFFLIPWAWFWMKGAFDRRWALRFLVGFLLGGLQGAMGWIMVASGLVDRPHVSHFRLAAHLLLAFFILSYFWRMAWSFSKEKSAEFKEDPSAEKAPSAMDKSVFISLKRILNLALGVLVFQIFFGALVAGLRAGFMSNTFPDMDGQFFPAAAWTFPSWIQNVLESPLIVQWVHRMTGWSLFFLGGGLFIYFRNKVSGAMRKLLAILSLALVGQFLLGVMTLLFHVQMGVAVAHQVGASLVLLILLKLRWDVASTI